MHARAHYITRRACNVCVFIVSIANSSVDAVAFNKTGEWIAIGSSQLGQLVVWEWQSESYVLKQQGHFNTMSCVCYSPDGMYVATGGDDGKVRCCIFMFTPSSDSK